MLYKKLALAILILFLLFLPHLTFATCPTGTQGNNVQLCNPLTGNTSSDPIPTFLGKIVLAVMGVVGSIALVMFIYGGFTWMTSGGNSEQITKGKNIVIWAVLGLIIIFTAYALVYFVIFTGLGVTAPTT